MDSVSERGRTCENRGNFWRSATDDKLWRNDRSSDLHGPRRTSRVSKRCALPDCLPCNSNGPSCLSEVPWAPTWPRRSPMHNARQREFHRAFAYVNAASVCNDHRRGARRGRANRLTVRTIDGSAILRGDLWQLHLVMGQTPLGDFGILNSYFVR